MNYEQARAFLETTKQYGSVLGLLSIRSLMEKLGNVQENLSIVHVAGTNGKGSVCAMLDQILREASYTVGCYSSPAVFSYLEIYRFNGSAITPEDYAACMERVHMACVELVAEGKPHPTSFEVETALAFVYFAQKKCDIVILETGMGGAGDATNLIRHPICAVLTDISMDHMEFLGNTPEEIAAVKAGIIKEKCPIVTISQRSEVMRVIAKRAKELCAPLTVAHETQILRAVYDADGMEIALVEEDRPDAYEVRLALSGAYQVRNALLAITAARTLQRCGLLIGDEHIRKGLANVRWSGRFETIRTSPRFIIDGAHNEAAAARLKDTIENCFTNRPITYIIGVLADKEYEKMLRLLLPYARKVYTVTPENPRALSGEILAAKARRFHADVTFEAEIASAVSHAVKGAAEDEIILAFGSLSYLAQVKEAVSCQLQENAEWRQDGR